MNNESSTSSLEEKDPILKRLREQNPTNTDELSEIELMRGILIELRKSNKYNERTSSNLAFFFWFTLVSIIVAIAAYQIR